ncbi:MAG: hypothetical protein ACYST3_08195, partial [Planctomycetota bacterium]
ITNILPQRNTVSKEENSLSTSVVTGRTRQGIVSADTKDQESVFEKVPYLIQRKLYAGKGGRGVGKSPDPMYLATVSCTACHKDKDLSVNPMACNVCHEKGFDKTMAEQKKYIKGILKTLSELLKESQRHGVPKSIINEARYNYDLVENDGSLGVHNIKYTKDLINHSIQHMKDSIADQRNSINHVIKGNNG